MHSETYNKLDVAEKQMLADALAEIKRLNGLIAETQDTCMREELEMERRGYVGVVNELLGNEFFAGHKSSI